MNVPTRVGVNRFALVTVRGRSQCPHACGGEPYDRQLSRLEIFNVPMRVGVNRRSFCLALPCRECPHACGGEPSSGPFSSSGLPMSPRVWG